MKSVKIAPSSEDLLINSVGIHSEDSEFPISYVVNSDEWSYICNAYKPEFIKQQFSLAIALCSKYWQIEHILNEFFHINGVIIV